MRAAAPALLAALLAAASIPGAAGAQTPAPPPPGGAATVPGGAPVAPPEELVRQQLLNAQGEILRLRRELADQTARAALVEPLEAKNRRLVEIGNELIAAYGRRYRRGHFGPFQLARRRFEQELQEVGDRVYQNRADVPAAAASPNGTPPAQQ